MQAAFATASML